MGCKHEIQEIKGLTESKVLEGFELDLNDIFS